MVQTFYRTHDNSVVSFLSVNNEQTAREHRDRKRFYVRTKSQYTYNSYVHGLNALGIKTLAVDEERKTVYHINNQVIHLKISINDNNKFVNLYKEKSLVKGKIIKTDIMTVSFYKNTNKNEELNSEVIISINVSGYAESLRLGILQLNRVGKHHFVICDDLRVSYTCATIRSSMANHSNVVSFRLKLKQKDFLRATKVHNFPVLSVGPPGEATLIHKGALLSRCTDKKCESWTKKKRKVAMGKDEFEKRCQCSPSYSGIGGRFRKQRIEGVCRCEYSCCEDNRFKVIEKCLEDINEVTEQPMSEPWSKITFDMEKSKSQLTLSSLDTSLKLGLLKFDVSAIEKALNLVNNDRKMLISRFLSAQNDTFSLLKPSTIHGGVPQVSNKPLGFSSKKNNLEEAAIKYRPNFFTKLNEVFGSDVGINVSKSIVKITGSCNVFVKLLNVSNVLFYSPLYGTIIDDLVKNIQALHGSVWHQKFPETFKLIETIKWARENKQY